jgi:hypothetical protein
MMSRVEAFALLRTERRTDRTPLGDDVLLDGKAVANIADIPDVYHGAIYLADWQVIERLPFQGAAVQAHVVFPVSDFFGAGWEDQILGVEGIVDVRWREALGVKLGEIEVDHDLALLPAIGERELSALDLGEWDADEIEAIIEKLRFVKGLAAEGDLEDRHIGGAVLENEWRSCAGRELPENGLVDGGDLGDAGLNLGPLVEEDLDDGDSVVGLGLDVLDVVDGGGHRALTDGDEALFHFLRGDAGVAPDDANDGNIDAGENIRGHPGDGNHAQEDDHDGHDREGVWAPKRQGDDPHRSLG